MKVNFINTIVFVKNIEKTKKFYSEVLGLKIINDYETIVFFENHFVIHNSQSIINTVFKKEKSYSKSKQGKNNLLIYFECSELDKILKKVKDSGMKIIHNIEKQAWDQNVFRFYDYDNHIVEIGEPFRLTID